MSFRKLQTNRANAARSTGPRTSEGKRRASQNARRHGCRSRTFLLPEGDDRTEFDKLQARFLTTLQPRTPIERSHVDEMVQAKWTERVLQLLQSRTQHEFFAAQPTGDYEQILQIPGFIALLNHELTQRNKFLRALDHLVRERRKPTIEPTLQNPYAPQPPVESAEPSQIATSEPTLQIPDVSRLKPQPQNQTNKANLCITYVGASHSAATSWAENP